MIREEIFKTIKSRHSSEDLDEDVHEVKSREAATINNGGLDSQLEFLEKACGIEWLEEAYIK